jgi:hypothetical protein
MKKMKIKILKVNPVGDIEQEEIMELPIVTPIKREIINGQLHEPMKRSRFLLEIGDFTYTINPDNGELNELEYLRKNYED